MIPRRFMLFQNKVFKLLINRTENAVYYNRYGFDCLMDRKVY